MDYLTRQEIEEAGWKIRWSRLENECPELFSDVPAAAAFLLWTRAWQQRGSTAPLVDIHLSTTGNRTPS